MVVVPVGKKLVFPLCANLFIFREDEGGFIERLCRTVINLSVTILAIVGGGVVGQNLDVLVAVIHLALLEVDGSVHLVTNTIEPGAHVTVIVVEATGVYCTERAIVIVVTIVNLLLCAVGVTVCYIQILVAAARHNATALEIHQVCDAFV